jgi:hypothetical protein
MKLVSYGSYGSRVGKCGLDASVGTVMNPRFPHKAGKFLTS